MACKDQELVAPSRLFRAFAPPRDAVVLPPVDPDLVATPAGTEYLADHAYVRRAGRMGVGIVVLSAFLVLLAAYAVGRGLVAAVWGI